VDHPVVVRRTHIAIDRFTGGVLPTALYTMEAVEAGSFVVRVEQPAKLPPSRVSEIRAIFRLVFEDLNDGIIGVGGGVARGYGSVSIAFDDAERSGELPSAAEARQALAGMVEEQ
jgi:CRISPR/Cas system CSM-associated protein Csm3 (group 7 of RAMP superfamily)